MQAVDGLEKKLREGCRGRLLPNEPMSNHTSFRVGGSADLLFFPADGEDVIRALQAARESGVPHFVMGNGTNLLVRDGGIRGLTIHMGGMEGIREGVTGKGPLEEGRECEISALGGTLLSRLINFTVDRGLAGLEFAAGIPGTVGGAAIMNAGAHGASIGDIITWAELIAYDGVKLHLARGEMKFFYRGSRWPREGVIAEVGLRLVYRGEAHVLDRVKYCLAERGRRLPLGVGMAGSVFKNPPGDFAGRLIESQGLKGLRAGNAEVSVKHGNVIVNLGGATAADVEGLVHAVERRVEEGTGIRLEREIEIVGEGGG